MEQIEEPVPVIEARNEPIRRTVNTTVAGITSGFSSMLGVMTGILGATGVLVIGLLMLMVVCCCCSMMPFFLLIAPLLQTKP